MKPGKRIAQALGLGPAAAEVIKQLIDQPLHVAMCASSVLAIAVAAFEAGSVTLWRHAGGITPEGVALPPSDLVLVSLVLGEAATVLWVAVREILQWPSSRWWDPPLDWAFEAGGCVLGAWIYLAEVAPRLC